MAQPYFTHEVHFTNPKGIYFVEKARLQKQSGFFWWRLLDSNQ